MKYRVSMKEIHFQDYAVEASSAVEALKKVEEGGGVLMEGAMEYSGTAPVEEWLVREWTDRDPPFPNGD